MSLMSASGGGTSASGNDAASPPVTPAEGVPPPAPLLAALNRLRVEGAGAAAAFDRLLAAEASPAWRGLALLGRGLCEEMHGSRAEAQVSVRSALEQWAAADPGACAVATLMSAPAVRPTPPMVMVDAVVLAVQTYHV